MYNRTTSEALKIMDTWIETVKNIKKDYERYGHKQWALKPIYPIKIEVWNDILGIAYVFVENREKPYILCRVSDNTFENQVNYLKRTLSTPVMVNIIWSGQYNFINVYIPLEPAH